MKVNKIDLVVIKAQCREALRLKRNNQCDVKLYSGEVQQLITLLEYAIDNNICKQL